MVNVNIYAQGDALSIEQKCDPSKLDLTIDGGFAPYEVEWQALVNGTWQTVSGWPKTNLNGNDGQEDFTSTLNYEEYKVIVHDNLCGVVEKEIVVDPCKCIKVELDYLHNVDHCQYPNSQTNTGSIGLSITGTNSYAVQWSTGATGLTLNKLVTGYYTATITAGACKIVKSYTICCCEVTSEERPLYPIILCNEDVNLEITDSQVYSPTTTTSYDGSITLEVNGGRLYTWYFNGNIIARTRDISGLGPGTYTVQIQDGCGATLLEYFTLVDCTSKNITVSGSVTNTCQGYKVGSISVSVNGGTPPIKYKWSNGASTSTISGLASGQYCVTVSDDEGCFKEKCFNVGLNDAQTIRTGCTFTTYCNGNVVNQYDIGSFSQVNSSDCRYIDYYCNDGYYLTSQFAGTTLTAVSNCKVEERCNSTGQLYQVHQGKLVTEFWGPGYNRQSDCYWCHNASYCYFPTLDWINPSSISLYSQFAYSYVPGSTKCDSPSCHVRVYCKGELIEEFCDSDCFERACTVSDLSLRYETEEEAFTNENGDEEIRIKYKVVSFDTLQAAQFLKDKRFQELDLETQTRSISINKIGEVVPNKVKMFPNPAFDYINFEFDLRTLNQNSNYRISLYNSLGQNVKSSLINLNNDKLYKMPILELSSGLYKIIIINENSGIQIYQSTIAKI